MTIRFAQYFFIMFVAVAMTPTMASARQQFLLIPGYTTTGFKKGHEVSFIVVNDGSDDKAGFGRGFVIGENVKPTREQFFELQVSWSGWLLYAATLGGGFYSSGKAGGLQMTAAGQFATPFLAFLRLQTQISPKAEVPAIMIGLMFKLPIYLGTTN